jgi:4-hydroxy-2-oxoheptanedioate aldolase
MIETASAFEDVSEIASLECVDGLFVGPADLSLARKRGVFAARPEDIADMARIARAARQVGKPWAVAAGNPAYRNEALLRGPAFATSADDLSALMLGFRQMLDRH